MNVAGWRDRIPSSWPARIYIGWVAALTLTSLGFLIAAAAADSMWLASRGGFFGFWALFWFIPSLVTALICYHQKKIAVEEKLDVIQDGIAQVQDLLGRNVPAARPEFRVYDGGRQ